MHEWARSLCVRRVVILWWASFGCLQRSGARHRGDGRIRGGRFGSGERPDSGCTHSGARGGRFDLGGGAGDGVLCFQRGSCAYLSCASGSWRESEGGCSGGGEEGAAYLGSCATCTSEESLHVVGRDFVVGKFRMSATVGCAPSGRRTDSWRSFRVGRATRARRKMQVVSGRESDNADKIPLYAALRESRDCFLGFRCSFSGVYLGSVGACVARLSCIACRHPDVGESFCHTRDQVGSCNHERCTNGVLMLLDCRRMLSFGIRGLRIHMYAISA